MSIDQFASYARQLTRNTPSHSSLPDWVNEGFPFPFHPQFQQLAEQFKEAQKQHSEAVEVVRFAIERKLEHPGKQDSEESIKECRKQEEETKKRLKQAEQALRKFNDHQPGERIALCESEIANLEIQLAEAIAEENEYTTQLLADLHAARARLDRIVHGHSGESVEYSTEQLSQLRSLRGTVEELQGRILSLQRDIQEINRLVAERDRQEQAQAAIAPTVEKFNQCCNSLLESLKQLDAISSQYGFRVIEPNDLHIPTSAVLDQTHNLIRIHGK